MSDHDFNEELDAVVETTIRLLQQNEHDDYTPVAFLSIAGDVDIMTLADDEEDDAAESDLPRLAREFGEHLAAEKHESPDCLFFAHLSKSEDGAAESIVVHGAAPDGRTNVAYINVTRDAGGHLRASSSKAWHSPAPLAATGNLALEVWKGITGA